MHHFFRLASVALAGLSALASAQSTLEQNFKNPPTSARPYVWWHWMGSNFSKDGITKDLEAMKAAGIGGATIFNIASAVQESHKPTLNNPWPDQTYRSPKYWEALRHAAAEAQRLGLEIGLHNTVGYSTTGGPWIDEAKNMRKIVSSSTSVDGGKPLSIKLPRPAPTSYSGWGNHGLTFSHYQDIAVLAVPATGVIDPTKIIDLTSSLRGDEVSWNAPAGAWQVVRIGHAPTGANPHPLPDELIGKTLEVDKMSLEQNRFHWDQVIDPIREHLGPLLGQSFRHFLIDSYEAGAQNWTPKFRDEFQKRKGYDPLPWLLTLEKRSVGSEELSARFQWDFTDIIRTLYYENGWLTGHEKIKSVGADLQFEPYGGTFDTVEGAALADIPMGEFWTTGGGSINSTIVAAARAAGRTTVGAEAFTGPPDLSKWSETPAYLKRSADGAYASGANRMILHHWVHQPFDDRYQPGMGMGWWGTHFNRHQTWAKDGTAFFKYLGRVQALLQAGQAPADFVSVGKAQGAGDVISWRLFRTGLAVRDGRILLPSGRSYPFLSIPHDGNLLPADLEIITRLLDQGATIVCAKPKGAPGLAGHPQSSEQVRSSPLWNGEPIRSIGKGKLHTQGDIATAIRAADITAIAQVKGAQGIAISARQTSDASLFFVANTTSAPLQFTASFRIMGKGPELWNAETAEIQLAPVWRINGARTEVDLTLNAYQSTFVVFQNSELPADHLVSAVTSTPTGNSLKITQARFGTPENQRWLDVTEKLRALAANGHLHLAAIHPGIFGRDPAPNVVKSLEVDYQLDGQSHTLRTPEGKALTLGTPQPASTFRLTATRDGSVTASSAVAETRVELAFASGKRQTLTLPSPAAPVPLSGTWRVHLKSPVTEPKTIELTTLQDLATHPDPAVKYFSGTATYSNQFEISNTQSPVFLELGKVHDLARITLNGKDLGVLWRPPFTLDLTPALKPGTNQLQVAVTNTWHNRLVGDEQFPADFEWGEDRGDKGHAMKSYPDWFVKNQARPEPNRKAFVTWYYHRKDTPLLPAGLVGPVQITPHAVARIQP
ncbi:MAG: hypothetical protein RLZZ245_812 [Verrucomicrobiota bacterium]